LGEEGEVMCATFHAQLDELIIELVRMARLASQMMTNANDIKKI